MTIHTLKYASFLCIFMLFTACGGADNGSSTAPTTVASENTNNTGAWDAMLWDQAVWQ